MRINAVNLTFKVRDLEETVSFYEKVLGLQKKTEWPTYAVFNLCGIMLGFEPAKEREAKSGLPDVYLQVEDVDQAYVELKAKGVRFPAEPKDQSWGARTARFVDPDGYPFILVQTR